MQRSTPRAAATLRPCCGFRPRPLGSGPAAGSGRPRAPPAIPCPPSPSNELVDLNSAVQGAADDTPRDQRALADKIIAGRPYLTKANLVTHNSDPHGASTQDLYSLVAAIPSPRDKK